MSRCVLSRLKPPGLALAEHDLMPLGADQGLGALVWSPLRWGRLTGNVRRCAPPPEGSRLHETASFGPPEDELLYRVVDVLEEIAGETGVSVPQVAIAWLLRRPRSPASSSARGTSASCATTSMR